VDANTMAIVQVFSANFMELPPGENPHICGLTAAQNITPAGDYGKRRVF
jgi:hypothetical protein